MSMPAFVSRVLGVWGVRPAVADCPAVHQRKETVLERLRVLFFQAVGTTFDLSRRRKVFQAELFGNLRWAESEKRRL